MGKDVYVSIDVEADGPIPGPYSMLSFGAAAFEVVDHKPNPTPLSTYYSTLKRIPLAGQDPSIMGWWAKNPEAWAATQVNPREPYVVMPEFLSWHRKLPGRPIVIGYNVTYDSMFLYWYIMQFGGLQQGANLNFRSALDIKTAASLILGVPYHRATKNRWPKSWWEGAPKHSHIPLEDAIEQGVCFLNMMKDRL